MKSNKKYIDLVVIIVFVFLVLSCINNKRKEKENIVHYYNTNYRSPKHEVGILWNDSLLKIKWPIKKPIISAKDKNNLSLKEFKKT